MAGTTPLIIQVPAREPISRRMSMDGMAELMLETIWDRIAGQVSFRRMAIIPAMAAERSRAIWLAPDKVSSPYMNTFSDSRIIKQTMGINACSRVGLFFTSSINCSENQNGKIVKEFNGMERVIHYKFPGNYKKHLPVYYIC
jgi:hypothetical protein